jgi:EAL domain-containing protein (putative c-di-GMP-specific phosphodiesterase class I)
VVHLTSGATDGFEALVRWRRAGESDLVTPDRLVPIAEEIGLIAQIGRWVVAEACRQLGSWNEARGVRLLRVSVNVSARELGRADFADGILRSLEDAGVDPAQLGLELTESALVEEPEAALAALDAVRAAGVRLLIDDFGTGYASLSYLKRFRPDELKLDRSFVTGLGEEGADTTIVAAIVGMAHALGLVVTGEGVERPEQLRALRALGCERAQGFLFARPAEAGAIDRCTSRAPGPRRPRQADASWAAMWVLIATRFHAFIAIVVSTMAASAASSKLEAACAHTSSGTPSGPSCVTASASASAARSSGAKRGESRHAGSVSSCRWSTPAARACG